MTDRELMQQALDALRSCTALPTWPSITPVIEALRTRLSQCERCGEVNPADIHTCSPLVGKESMTTYTIEVTHDKEGVTVVIKDLDPDTMGEDRAAIEYALEEALRITKEHNPMRFQ